MAYIGGVPVNSGFYPRGNFPIVNAKDVYVSDSDTLLALLERFGVDINAINTDLATINDIINLYILQLNYENTLAFNINEIVIGTANAAGTSATLGTAVLGKMVLG